MEPKRFKTKQDCTNHVRLIARTQYVGNWAMVWKPLERDARRITGYDPAKLKAFERELRRAWVQAMPEWDRQGREFWTH